MATVDSANIFVDFNGNGVQSPIFHPTLQLCYMQGTIDVPALTANDWGMAYWEFNLPAGLTNPFLYCTSFRNADYAFEQKSGSTWTLIVSGLMGAYTDSFDAQTKGHWRGYSTPINNAGEIKIYYGGYRG